MIAEERKGRRVARARANRRAVLVCPSVVAESKFGLPKSTNLQESNNIRKKTEGAMQMRVHVRGGK